MIGIYNKNVDLVNVKNYELLLKSLKSTYLKWFSLFL